MIKIHGVTADQLKLGLAYISEPVFAGNFNELLRLFHDEELVRLAAFNAIKQALDCGLFSLEKQYFQNKVTEFLRAIRSRCTQCNPHGSQAFR